MTLMPASQQQFGTKPMYEMSQWTRPGRQGIGPSSLDTFDPYSHMDRTMNQNVRWINEPDAMVDIVPAGPQVPEKYRITIDCTGFNETSINTQIKENTLIVEGAEGDPSKKGIDDFSYKEFKRTFDLPPNIIRNRMVSFLTNQGILVIEFPFRDDRLRRTIYPKIVDIAGVRGVELDIVIPENVDPNKVTVTVWDHDLIIRADYRVQKPDGFSRIHYLRRSTFPQNTNWDSLKCVADQHDLTITAELGPRFKKAVRVEFKHQQPQQQQQQAPRVQQPQLAPKSQQQQPQQAQKLQQQQPPQQTQQEKLP